MPVGDAPGSPRVDMRHLACTRKRAAAAASTRGSAETGVSDNCGDPQGAFKPLGRARRCGTLGGAHGSAIAPSEAAAREYGRGGCRAAHSARRENRRAPQMQGPDTDQKKLRTTFTTSRTKSSSAPSETTNSALRAFRSNALTCSVATHP